MATRASGRRREGTAVRQVPAHLIGGVALIAVAWPLAWSGARPWSEHTFFPLWLGYILVVDGATLWRSGSSLVARDGRRFALLFGFSVPLWWLFEFANRSLGNWRYVPATEWSPGAYLVLASIAFSTVMPALFATAELYRTFPAFRRPRRWVRIAPSRTGLAALAAAGLALFVLSLVFPRQAFPLVWIGMFLFLDPLNALLGNTSIAREVAVGRWDTVLTLFAAGLTCGFFWEMWNIRSLPKWVYDVPYVAEPRLFEMPWLGYGGYLPFALEVYAAYHLLVWVVWRRRDGALRFDAASTGDDRGGSGDTLY